MENTNMIIAIAITIAAIGAAIAAYYYKKKKLKELFEQAYEYAKQVPKQKKNSVLLLMFMEAVSASKNKSKSSAGNNKLSNPKYFEIQLIQMSKILKSDKKSRDKKTKRAFRLLKDYQAWEEAKNSNDVKAKKNKTA